MTGLHGWSGIQDSWVIKLDFNGNVEWKKCFGGGYTDATYSIQQTQEGGYVMAGMSNSIDGDLPNTINPNLHPWIVKMNASGVIEWQSGELGAMPSMATYVQQTLDGGYVFTGKVRCDNQYTWMNCADGDELLIAKLNANGAFEWQQAVGGSSNEIGYGLQQTFDGGYIVIGITSSMDYDATGNHGGKDMWVIKYSATTNITENLFDSFSISPNPTNGKINIELKEDKAKNEMQVEITNLFGQSILNEKIENTNHTLDISTQESGMYFIYLKDKDGHKTVQKIQKY